jgi:hypothetical protein
MEISMDNKEDDYLEADDESGNNNDLVITVSIPNYTIINDIVYYNFVIENQYQYIMVKKRYSELYQLYQKILQSTPNVS